MTDRRQPPLLISDDGGVRTLTLNRPAVFNSFNLALKSALLTAMRGLSRSGRARRRDHRCGPGVLRRAGPASEHLALVEAADPRLATTVAEFYNPLVRAVTALPKPVIAAVNGPAAGAGAGLAFASDLRIAGESATFSMAFAGVALSADTGASFLLPRLIGHGRASRMMLLGREGRRRRGSADRNGRRGGVGRRARRARGGPGRAAWPPGPTRAYGWIKASLHHARRLEPRVAPWRSRIGRRRRVSPTPTTSRRSARSSRSGRPSSSGA